MDRGEKILYHQIHPLKLFTDVVTAMASTGFFWMHRPLPALIVGFVPSVAITGLLVRWADLERYRASAFGRYMRRFMTRRVELARLAGLIPVWGGAWLRRPAIIVLGVAWIVGCWLWGLRLPRSTNVAG